MRRKPNNNNANRCARTEPRRGRPADAVRALGLAAAFAALGPLTALARLTVLGADGNGIANVAPLDGLDALRQLDLGGHPAAGGGDR